MEENVAVIDKKGRIMIPSKIRRSLNLKSGTKLKINVIGGRIFLEHIVPAVKRVEARRRWGKETFLDAGEATFGES